MRQKEVLIVVGILLVSILFLNKGGSMKPSDSATGTGNYIYPCYNFCKEAVALAPSNSGASSTECNYAKGAWSDCGTCRYTFYTQPFGYNGPNGVNGERITQTRDCFRSPKGLFQVNKIF